MGAPELVRELVCGGRRAGGRDGVMELVGEHGFLFRDPPPGRARFQTKN